MIRLLGTIPSEIYIAVSGGPDSMAALDFLRRKHTVTAAYFDHGTPFSAKAQRIVVAYCGEHDIRFIMGNIRYSRKKEQSLEEYWRNERIAWLHSLGGTVVTAHNLDDALEWYIFSALNGKTDIIPYRNKNIIRPFLLTPKSELSSWDERKGVPFLHDPSNKDRKFARSIIRHDIVPQALRVNPGLYKVIKKMVEREYGGEK